ncbi:Glutathione S-transferase 3 [Gluconacetobacter sp. SXCC-1]|uniref:glutathione transferase n=1 Tax=Komagataeibacter rhaeticus TaxID=215221 RepID=A0A181CCS1_9PROT|nr:glutathione S-transferase [Komagataeibacter rhaeticus]ATU71822.1 glutathione S-transferase [Komagataeibacter xylinus]EGG75803.1 Glutathione S-transferase 3 [Gluconacetobacter sp. SXCC-1]QIP36058.1 glutathione S-transferase [Komagataeibacter rhaeticus]QOC45819.1 glutathione S-transferase [Komagataeibacter rhaeticus]WPP21512.1 glutathione S-transferase [Komagataeibacter rhaeticus]
MLTVHHLDNSRSQRVLWLLEELELPYDIHFYSRDPKTMQAPQSLRRIHPLGKAPVLTDTDGDVTLAESGAIIEYVLARYGHGRLEPAHGTPAHTRFIYWLHYAEGSAMPPLLLKLVLGLLPGRVPWPLRPFAALIAGGALTKAINPQVRLHMDYWEQSLAASEWFAGPEFTAADIQMSFPLEVAAARAGALAGRPHIGPFLRRIHARPACQRALVRGGSYAYATAGNVPAATR